MTDLNVVLVTFDTAQKAYDQFNQFKSEESTEGYTILEMAVVKKEGGVILAADGYEDGYDDTNNTGFGGIIGAVVGVLGGPIGVLLGTGIGLAAGMAIDDKDVADDDSLMEWAAQNLAEGQTALAMVVKEHDEAALDTAFNESCAIYRWDADVVTAEVEHAEALRDQLAAATRKQLREARKAARQAK